MFMSRRALRLALCIAAGTVCAGGAWQAAAIGLSGPFGAPVAGSPSGAVILGTGGKTGLEYWPLTAKGSRTPTEITGISGLHPSGGIAAEGNQIVIPNGNNVIVYNVQSKHETVLPDPAGYPLDAAIGKDGTIYVSNLAKNGSNVLVYPRGHKPYEVTCGLSGPDNIAVDNEGDVFLNDVTLTAVVEIPKGLTGLDAAHCTTLKLAPRESGYAAGIAIDPKTDDLLVLDDPSLCAGGLEGRLVIHHKPYERGTGRVLNLGANCSGRLRLDATSSLVFIGDASVSGPPSYILQHSYPDGKFLGGYFGGSPGAFITIPNTLPN